MVHQQYSCPCSNVSVRLETSNGVEFSSDSCLTEVLEDNVEEVNELSTLIQTNFKNQNSCGISKVFEVLNQSQWLDSLLEIVNY